MKLYTTATGVIVGTQADAKRNGKGWTQIEVPTDKPGLIAYLNAQREDAPEPDPLAATLSDTNEGLKRLYPGGPSMAEKLADPRPAPGTPLVDPKPPAPRVDTEAVWTATQIEDFIFNRATVVQIGNIMGALGERFGELVAKSSRSER